GQALPARTVVAVPRDFQDQVGATRPGRRQGAEGDLHSFITLQAANVQERGLRGAWGRAVGTVPGRVHPRVDDLDAVARHAPAHQVVPRALGDRVERRAAVHPGNGDLGEPDE